MREPFFQELSNWMRRVKYEEFGKCCGKAMGHDINWTVVKKGDPRDRDGHLTLEFETEEDKIFFILKL